MRVSIPADHRDLLLLQAQHKLEVGTVHRKTPVAKLETAIKDGSFGGWRKQDPLAVPQKRRRRDTAQRRQLIKNVIAVNVKGSKRRV